MQLELRLLTCTPRHSLAPPVICYELPSNSKIRQVCTERKYGVSFGSAIYLYFTS